MGYTKSVWGGREDVWLVKTDKSGNVVWQKTIGGTKNDAANSIALTQDGGYVALGYTYSKGSKAMYGSLKPMRKATHNGSIPTASLAHQAVAVLPTAHGGYWIAAYH